MPVAMIRNRITLKPMRCRSFKLGSAAQLRKLTTSCDICGTVAWVPSEYLSWSVWPSGALKHLALVVGAVCHLILRGNAFDLVLGVADLLEIAEGKVLHRVADRADFLVDLKTPLRRRRVIGAKHAFERPLLVRRLWRFLQRARGAAESDGYRQREQESRKRGAHISAAPPSRRC